MTSRLSAASAIVLAGGGSRRFGRDKLAEPLQGGTLLDRALGAVRQVADDVVVVAAPGHPPPVPEWARVIHDEEAYQGPLAGLLGGLLVVREPLVVLVGGDMPTLVPAVLALLLRTLEATSADVAVLEHLGRREHLPMAVRAGAATTLARSLVAQGERRLGAVLDRSVVIALPDGAWRPLDLDAATIRDVDEPGDLPA